VPLSFQREQGCERKDRFNLYPLVLDSNGNDLNKVPMRLPNSIDIIGRPLITQSLPNTRARCVGRLSPIDDPPGGLTVQTNSLSNESRVEMLFGDALTFRFGTDRTKELQRSHSRESLQSLMQLLWGRAAPGFNMVLSAVLIFSCVSLGMVSIVWSQSASRTEQAKRENLRQLLEQGKSLATEGRLAEAEGPLLEASQLAPNDFETQTTLAKVQVRIGKSPEAIERFRKIAGLYPQRADSHLNLGIALAEAKEFDKALKETSLAASLAPKMPSAHVNRGRILDDLFRPDEARAEFAIAYRLDPENADCLYYWALVEHASGDFKREAELLQKLLVLQPKNYKALYFLGRNLKDQSRDSEAIVALRRALAIQPNYEDALYLLSRELRKTAPEESKQLDEEFRAARQQQSVLDSVKSLGNEAYQAALKKAWPEAISLLRKAVEICDSCEASAGLHKNLGLALCQNGDVNAGRIELETSLKLNPDDPDVVKALNVIGR
jgi:tetratricopeptide (TPR) repeat protein